MAEKAEQAADQRPLNLTEKMRAIRAELVLVKDAVNPHFQNEYVSLDSVLDALNPLLKKYNLHMEQGPGIHRSGQPCIVTTFYDMDYDPPPSLREHPLEVPYRSYEWPIPMHDNPQKTASGSTYARRYSIVCIFALTAEDDDGEMAAAGRGSGKSTKRGAKELLERLGK